MQPGPGVRRASGGRVLELAVPPGGRVLVLADPPGSRVPELADPPGGRVMELAVPPGGHRRCSQCTTSRAEGCPAAALLRSNSASSAEMKRSS